MEHLAAHVPEKKKYKNNFADYLLGIQQIKIVQQDNPNLYKIMEGKKKNKKLQIKPIIQILKPHFIQVMIMTKGKAYTMANQIQLVLLSLNNNLLFLNNNLLLQFHTFPNLLNILLGQIYTTLKNDCTYNLVGLPPK